MLCLPFEHWLVILSALINICGSSLYLRNTLTGRTKPNRVSWSMWSIAPMVSTLAAVSSGADLWPTVKVFLAGFLPFLVFLASFWNRQSYWRISGFDFSCGLLSGVALYVWIVYADGPSAILLAALADGSATIPTLRKAWLYPESETRVTFLAALLSVVLILPSIPVWNIKNAGFQLYLLLSNSLIVFTCYRREIGSFLFRQTLRPAPTKPK